MINSFPHAPTSAERSVAWRAVAAKQTSSSISGMFGGLGGCENNLDLLQATSELVLHDPHQEGGLTEKHSGKS